MAKIVVAGTRTFNDFQLLCKTLDWFLVDYDPATISILSGHAPTGADYHGERYSWLKGLDLQLYPADWKAYGRSAGPVRNKLMAEAMDRAIVFWDGSSRGSLSMINEGLNLSKPVFVLDYLQKVGYHIQPQGQRHYVSTALWFHQEG